ncbi:MAG: aminotransferase class I/II-fold pyridoxal phosphate-dependent enzyme [Clostridia bacterium]|nr:aminotransferase class I/II-fold pyridoxal phosphate-dependent enzyme [Clostridia bacterium]MDY6183799.1 aminotransferase class I/II-fold pyridoxal phosphate-dependent enzyme [Eubacteriales bacterium]
MTPDYSERLSKRARAIEPSGIRRFFDLLDDMEDVVSLTVGQPDFITPWHIRTAAIESLEAGKTYYTSNRGLTLLREEICKYLARRFSLSYDPASELLVTVGGSEAIDLVIRGVVDPGDEVIIPTPCFVCYEPLVTLSGGVPVIIETKEEDLFRLTPEALKAALTPKTKLLILPFPNNPTGAVMPREDLEKIADVLRGTNVLVLSDEIYAELTYGARHVSIASLPGMRERTLLVSGFSKAYAMTGWRLGYLAAPADMVKEIFKIHQYGIMCAPTTAQFGAIEAMQNGDGDIAEMVAEYDRRRKYLVKRLRELGLTCFEPQGAFYVFPNISEFGMTSEKFCEKLLYDYRVAIVPGTAFGKSGEGFARISYAYSVSHLDKALERMTQMLHDLRK